MTNLNLKEKEYILYIEPYVYINKKKDSVVLYNTLSGAVVYVNKPDVLKLIKKLQSSSNLYVIVIKGDVIRENKNILNFIKKIRESFIGDITKKKKNYTKPVQLIPILNNYKDIKKIKADSGLSIGDNLLEYLNEITIYINNSCNQSCDICRDAFKQIKFCTKSKKNTEIDLNLLKSFLKSNSSGNVSKINILGGDIFFYSKLHELIDVLRDIEAERNIYIHYLNLFENIDKIEIMSNENITILISDNFDKEKISKIENYTKKKMIKKSYIFTITDEKDFNNAQEIISILSLKNYSFIPVYNGKNIDFFKENTYIESDNLVNIKLSIKDIFAKNSMNILNFGKIIIRETGKIYSNMNGKCLGKLKIDSIKDVIYKELNSRNGYWLRSRSNTVPCKECLNNFLCPPLSNYEYVMKRNNLCNIEIK